ncbi:hypothetical protein RvY_05825 [Ramazzottius varieornatus]|uniref:U3 small nucleolar RNA-associated protein 11 n=1 Tax=Ramazzottius varieornatus TaxID=947166 RepID=A0A1D1UZZ7_RAMVA|nr:hypothetical protein RvY_05825 [Ramazzottius varieornatus]
MSTWTRTSKAQQRIHKERSQPESRQKLGFLEKKKDYKLRAADHERKKTTIKALRQKALDRNPDEFYFHMHNSKVENGKHMEKKKKDDDTDEQMMLLQSQNLAYIRSKCVAEQKKIDRLKSSLSMTFTGKAGSKHKFFAEDGKEKQDLSQKLLQQMVSSTGTQPQDESWETLTDSEKTLAKQRRKSVKELEQRMAREKQLRITEQKLQVRKLLLGKTKPIRLKDASKDAPAVYKWEFSRKR